MAARSVDCKISSHSAVVLSVSGAPRTSNHYESYADIGLNEWIKLKIEVQGVKAKLYVNESKQPVLVVNDLKHGADAAGEIGFWVDVGTEGYFTEMYIYDEAEG